MFPFTVRHNGSPAILAPGRPQLSYGELAALIDRTASQLQAAGIGDDDRVVLIAPNGPEAAAGFLGIAAACQCAPLNPGYRDAELAFYFEDLKPKLIIYVDEPPPPAKRLKIPTARMCVDPAAPAGSFSLPDLPPPAGIIAPHKLSSTALLLHTSGTTSRPKLVPLTW